MGTAYIDLLLQLVLLRGRGWGGYRAIIPAERARHSCVSSGRINPLFIVKGFLSGADMVMVLGCHFGDCHYLKGNYTCDMRMTYLKAYLQAIGINPERLYRIRSPHRRRSSSRKRCATSSKRQRRSANRQRNWRVRTAHGRTADMGMSAFDACANGAGENGSTTQEIAEDIW